MRKWLILLIISLAVILLLVLLICIALPMFAIGGEFLLVKTNIQNPYVNSGFRNWKQVSIENEIYLFIPQQWTLEKERSGYVIVDENGHIWANGNFVDIRGDQSVKFDDILYQALRDQVQDVKDLSLTSSLMDGSYLSKIAVYGSKRTVECYVASLFLDVYSDFYWVVECDPAVDEIQHDILEAITYSYAFYTDLKLLG